MIAAELANMPDDGNRKKQQDANLHSGAEAASKLNVSERSVKMAKCENPSHMPPTSKNARSSVLVAQFCAARLVSHP